MTAPYRIALVLGGGNALGSYQAGVYQALHEREMTPDWVVGTSAGAINGALIAGNKAEDRLARLAAFWRPAETRAESGWWPSPNETLRRTAAVMTAMTAGQPGVFNAVGPLGSWWDVDASAAAPSLFDSKPLKASLERLVDFDLLNAGSPRYTACAVDVESGDEALFDTAQQALTADHVRASAALLPTFPPVAIGERVFVDGGVSANLPLDPVLGDRADRPTLCIAADLLPLAAPRPQTLGEATERAQDLIFAGQSRRTIERWQGVYAHDPRFARASTTLVRLTYADQEPEVSGKSMDFSPASVLHRWDAGYRDAQAMLDRINDGRIVIGQPGLMLPEF